MVCDTKLCLSSSPGQQTRKIYSVLIIFFSGNIRVSFPYKGKANFVTFVHSTMR